MVHGLDKKGEIRCEGICAANVCSSRIHKLHHIRGRTHLLLVQARIILQAESEISFHIDFGQRMCKIISGDLTDTERDILIAFVTTQTLVVIGKRIIGPS